ncbi:hypothetical protein D3C85_1283630 [compost metagenome]
MTQRRARGAALDQQLAFGAAFPEEPGVIAHARLGPFSHCLGRRLFGLGRLWLGVGRTELEHPEQLLTDLLILARLFGEVTHHQGDEKTRAQTGGFFIAHRLQSSGVIEPFTRSQVALEGQLGIDRDHRGVAIALDKLEHLVGVLGGRAWRVIVQVETFHAPDLQHRCRRHQAIVAAVGSH